MFDQRGVTFLEVLLVLSIMALFLSILLPSYEGTLVEKEIETFIDQFQTDFNWALQFADTYQKIVYFNILKRNNIYYFRSDNKNILVRYIPNRIRIDHTIQNDQIIIHTTGTISNNGTIRVYYNDKLTVSLYIQFYSGVIREEWH